MKYGEWGKLVCRLLFVGVLGGLMAPLASEAQPPTITVSIDGVQVAPVKATGVPSILRAGNSTCTSVELSLGYTHCYGIRTSATTTYPGANGRRWTIKDHPHSTARLRIADWGGHDKFSLVGVQIVPVPWNTPPQTASRDQYTNESHQIKITMTNTFNSFVNVDNAAFIGADGGYIWALRIGGEFGGGPAGEECNFVLSAGDSLCDAVGDKVEYTASGLFTGTTREDILSPPGSPANTQPLRFTVAGPHDAPLLSFSGNSNQKMGQVEPYPRFNCSKQGAETTCQQNITQIMTVTLIGEDKFVLVGGEDGDGARCQPSSSDLGCPGSTLVNIAQAIEQASDEVAFIQDGAVPAVPTGTITIKKHTSGPGGGETEDIFTFNVTGPSPSTPSISMVGGNNGEVVVTVNPGTYDITENPHANWSLTSSYCVEDDDHDPTTGVEVPPGGNVNCDFFNSAVR